MGSILERKGVREMAKDPVCGMEVDEQKAAATAEHEGKTYYFCCSHCKMSFEKEPQKYVEEEGMGGHMH